MTILIDIDGVIANIGQAIVEKWQELYPNEETPSTEMLTGISDDPSINKKVYDITHAQGFFTSLKPLEGALEAIQALRDAGHDVFLVTSAGVTYEHAASEKYNWVKERFDQEMLSKLIITPAKYAIKGDILIDDRATLVNEDQAEWEHYVFDAPYNQHVTDKKRLNWTNWQDVLPL